MGTSSRYALYISYSFCYNITYSVSFLLARVCATEQTLQLCKLQRHSFQSRNDNNLLLSIVQRPEKKKPHNTVILALNRV